VKGAREGSRWVKLTTVDHEIEATLLVEALKEEGIPAFARAGGAGPGYFSPATLPHLIFVEEKDLERARTLVSSLPLRPEEP